MIGLQTLLAASGPVAGAKRPDAGRKRLDQTGPTPLGAVAGGWSSRVGANSATGEPIADAAYKAEIVLPDTPGGHWPLVRQDEQMAGSFHETQMAGDYAIEVTATLKDQPLGSTRARFLVFRQDLELDNASADAPTLESLAAMTGGQSLAPKELPDLIRTSHPGTRNTSKCSKKRRKPSGTPGRFS